MALNSLKTGFLNAMDIASNKAVMLEEEEADGTIPHLLN